MAWRISNDLEMAKDDVWKRVAYACRYGKGVTMAEVLCLPHEHLGRFIMALDGLVKEENEAGK